MNKQQLASKIWASANKMRSKIEANEYKDYILGFIFYKFLSDKIVELCERDGMTADMRSQYLNEENPDYVARCHDELGYFISHEDLFSTWIDPKNGEFSVDNVTVALTRFARLISPGKEKVYKGIFDTLQNGLGKLGENTGAQTKSIRALLRLIKDIPTDDRQDYDVLGFIYEYLISNFAANAGKKAGEFYTPHEVALMMSDIVAHHLRDRKKIKIYDPTSGSGSLLLNIGRSVGKYLDKGAITYYAQELKESTYNLTRMNLVMRGIHPDNIVVRNGDTLEQDWPWFDDADPYSTYEYLRCDAVVSNPPYSQEWTPDEQSKSDPRFKKYGVAPKGTADYAFLLHDLYHLEADGIMTIVLPHGVLFRGGEEEKIRRNLVEKNNIDAVIGLPANIFFGTGIPTIVMVLKQNRPNDDILFVDASKGFAKIGTNNQLRARDIRKIVDAVTGRRDIDGFSRAVSRDTIRDNDYNLNIPRYINSSEPDEPWDIYATMFGGIPDSEIDVYAKYWDAFPSLRTQLFAPTAPGYSRLVPTIADLCKTVGHNDDVSRFLGSYYTAVEPLYTSLYDAIVKPMGDEAAIAAIKPLTLFQSLSAAVFDAVGRFPLVDPYAAYQIFDDRWQGISGDIEIIQAEGLKAANAVDPNMVVKKKDGKEVEVQEGWLGRIIPLDLVQKTLLQEETEEVAKLSARLDKIDEELQSIIDTMTDEELAGDWLNDDNTKFNKTPLKNKVKFFQSNFETPELNLLREYQEYLKTNNNKKARAKFVSDHYDEIDWNLLTANNDGTIGSTGVKARIAEILASIEFEEGSLAARLSRALELLDQEKAVKDELKAATFNLEQQTIATIESLDTKQILELLDAKWVVPIVEDIERLSREMILSFASSVATLSKKYAKTLVEIDNNIAAAEEQLAVMIDDLQGTDSDNQGLAEFQKLLRHE